MLFGKLQSNKNVRYDTMNGKKQKKQRKKEKKKKGEKIKQKIHMKGNELCVCTVADYI
jgi:hypothetical protein